MTFGYSPAALERLMDEALVIALTHGRSAMNMSDVSEAKMLVELGVTDADHLHADERDRVATHEAGHATVAYFVGQSRQLDVLSIVKRRDSLGLLQHSDTEERFTQSRDELNALLQIAMGGMVAEEHWFDEVSTGPASDLAAATTIGGADDRRLRHGRLAHLGGGRRTASGRRAGRQGAGRQGGPGRARRAAQRSCDVAMEIVTEHPEVVEALRDALLERDELVGAEITDVIEESPAGVRHSPVGVTTVFPSHRRCAHAGETDGAAFAAAACAVVARLGALTPAVVAGSGSVAGASMAGRVGDRAGPGLGVRTRAAPAAPGSTTQLLAAGGQDGGLRAGDPPRLHGRDPMPVIIDLHGYGRVGHLPGGR